MPGRHPFPSTPAANGAVPCRRCRPACTAPEWRWRSRSHPETIRKDCRSSGSRRRSRRCAGSFRGRSSSFAKAGARSSLVRLRAAQCNRTWPRCRFSSRAPDAAGKRRLPQLYLVAVGIETPAKAAVFMLLDFADHPPSSQVHLTQRFIEIVDDEVEHDLMIRGRKIISIGGKRTPHGKAVGRYGVWLELDRVLAVADAEPLRIPSKQFLGIGRFEKQPSQSKHFCHSLPLCQFDFRADRTGALMSCHYRDSIAGAAAHYPFDLRTIVCRVIVRPERNARVLVRLAFELANVFAPLPADQLDTRRKRNFRDDAPNHFALEGPLAHIARQPPGVLHDEPYAPSVFAYRIHFRHKQLELRRKQCLPNQPFREPRDFALEKLRWWISECVEAIPSADFHGAQVRMVEGFPIDVRHPAKLGFVPAKDFQIVIDRMIAKPVDV